MAKAIKFRVWDKTFKRMHICGEDVHDSMSFDFNNNSFYYNLQNGCGGGTDDDPDSEYILMQYTGLKDKNGIEIYEGDIVIPRYNRFKPMVVEFKDGHYPIREYNLKRCEVIGNIYEHPHLLKEANQND